ncbi:hypothetical protein [Alteraurantiacibacter palmitatis]|uniref:Metal-dependent phosphohydrolase 7TM extracellular domain-containing protein n=1 Tax=Alteraurantiacibacter palmitatis TaxID=2054628 RepID=A0ABV7E2X2_9SPHN
MKQFLRRISPRRAVADFVTVWRQPTRHRWGLLGVAIAMTFALFMLFIPKSQMVEPEMPEVIYISTWAEGRSEAEIIASNCRNQQLRDELESLLAERAEIRRDIYKALGRATFIDVDAIEAEAEAARAAEQAANAVPLPDDVDPLARLSVEEYCARAGG